MIRCGCSSVNTHRQKPLNDDEYSTQQCATLNTLLIYTLSSNSNLICLDLYLIMFTAVPNIKDGIELNKSAKAI